jgi:uncharacterized protein YjbI with pentapeptide repeats
MSPEKLQEIIAGHGKWLRGEEGGTRAVLTGAVLTGAVLRDAVLTGAVLRDAVLRDAVLTGADLTGADLRGGKFIARASVQFSAHGEYGRELTAIRTDAKENPVTLWCGCFMGTPEELRKYIAEGADRYAASRALAMETVLKLLDCGTEKKGDQ